MSRLYVFSAFIGPGHKRHAFYAIGEKRIPACNAPTAGKIINHEERNQHRLADVDCAACKRVMERVTSGSTPDHLAGLA